MATTSIKRDKGAPCREARCNHQHPTPIRLPPHSLGCSPPERAADRFASSDLDWTSGRMPRRYRET